jgi:hypothetical protein
MRAAFVAAMPQMFAVDDFLETFRAAGCYLDDLCLEPLNNLPDRERKEKRTQAEGPLAPADRR